MKSRHWLFLLGGLLLGSLLLLLLFFQLKSDILVAEIYQNGILVETINLNTLTVPKEIRLVDEEKENVILAEPDGISMQSANCPDKLCVHQGKIQNGIYPIVCLPNKVVIQLKASQANHPDTISR